MALKDSKAHFKFLRSPCDLWRPSRARRHAAWPDAWWRHRAQRSLGYVSPRKRQELHRVKSGRTPLREGHTSLTLLLKNISFIYLATLGLSHGTWIWVAVACELLVHMHVGSRSLTRGQTQAPALGAQNLSHGTTGKSQKAMLLNHLKCMMYLLFSLHMAENKLST